MQHLWSRWRITWSGSCLRLYFWWRFLLALQSFLTNSSADVPCSAHFSIFSLRYRTDRSSDHLEMDLQSEHRIYQSVFQDTWNQFQTDLDLWSEGEPVCNLCSSTVAGDRPADDPFPGRSSGGIPGCPLRQQPLMEQEPVVNSSVLPYRLWKKLLSWFLQRSRSSYEGFRYCTGSYRRRSNNSTQVLATYICILRHSSITM